MKYWIITCHRGHLGTGNRTEIKSAIKAPNLIKAQDIARRMPERKAYAHGDVWI